MAKQKATRTIGLDYGIARIGIACSDEQKILATSLKTLQADKKSKSTVKNLADAIKQHQKEFCYDIDQIVVGLPLLMSGKSGFMADEVTHFVELLKEAFPGIPIHTWDERLTSTQAERSMKEGGLSRKRRSKAVDAVAAMIILQSFLDRQSILISTQESVLGRIQKTDS